MQAILPGKPQAKLQAVDHGTWEDQRVIAYISGSALVILNGPQSLLQTIYHEEEAERGLEAVTYHNATGRIAATSEKSVYIYGLREEVKGTLSWSFEFKITLPEAKDTIRTLSWGSDEELLVGSDNITLFSTHLPSSPGSPTLAPRPISGVSPIWSRPLSSPASHAAFSPTASLIATLSSYDCLVKIWRRLSFEAPQFDYAYLRHPAPVTWLEWRRVGDVGDEEDILYTICADGKFRCWKSGDAHSIEILALDAEIDLNGAIQPRDIASTQTSSRRYAFVIGADVLSRITEKVTKDAADGRDKHAKEYVHEVVSRKPDVVVVLDGQGHMSAWGLENVGCKKRHSGQPRQASAPFHVAHVEGLTFGFRDDVDDFESYSRLLAFPSISSDQELTILAHHFDGRLLWHEAAVQDLFNPSTKKNRIRRVSTWTGHQYTIKKVIRTASGKSLISRTDHNNSIIWTSTSDSGRSRLQRRSIVDPAQHIHRTVILREGEFFVFLHHDSISLWDARAFKAREIGRCSYSLQGKPLCLLVLPELHAQSPKVHLATVTSNLKGLVWELDLPLSRRTSIVSAQNGSIEPSIHDFCNFELDAMQNVTYVLPVDPAGSSPIATGFLDSFAQDVALAYSSDGLLRTYTARINVDERKVEFLTTATVETNISEPSLGSATSIRKAAVVDKSRSTLTIWDTRSGRMDHEEKFLGQMIQDLDWASTLDNQSILAVGFAHRVLVYTQLRYDYINERPAWARIKDISIADLTPHPIGDSVWLGNGNLVIGAGNQLFLASDVVDLQRDLEPELQSSIPHSRATHLYDLVCRMNGPLPVFHPQFIAQCVLGGKINLAHRILVTLHKTLKFYTEGDELDLLQGLSIDDFVDADTNSISVPNKSQRSYQTMDDDDEPSAVTEEISASLTALLTQKSIPHLASAEQFGLADVTECMAIVEKHQRSIDDNAARYLLFWREAIIRSHQRKSNNASKSDSAPAVSWREVVWAYHSSSQDILVDLITRHYNGKLEWRHARDSGMFMWLTDRKALSEQFEAIARNAYSTKDPKDPVDCSLYYLALRKKAVLVGLWRMATWSREQPATMRLLRNDFTDQKWKTTAAKNAYALMGKRRFEYAAAFFLLADNLDSAVSVIANQMDDIQLAVAVARVYGGDDCLELKTVLETRALPKAVAEGNRWQATWCFWLLGQRSNAVRALVSPLHNVITLPGVEPESLQAKSFLNDDPALVILYRQLREKSLQTLKGALMVTGTEEWNFVTKTASLLRRMGCDILALDLVRNWEFLQPPQPTKKASEDEAEERKESVSELPTSPTVTRGSFESDIDPRKLLRRRSSLVVADMPMSPSAKTPGSRPVASMLDDYGFDQPAAKPQKPQQKTRSMLDDFEAPAQAAPAPKQKSMLDDFGFDDSTQPREQPPKPKSMLDDFEAPVEPNAAPKQKSMLDDFGFDEPVQSQPKAQKVKSLLDSYEEAQPETPKPQPQAPPKQKSMLDDFGFDEPAQTQPKIQKVRSLLDSYEDSSSSSEGKSRLDKDLSADPEKKEPEHKEEQKQEKKQEQEKKQPPKTSNTEAASIMDSFDF
ncbi:hypothetical protein MBLNU457_4224t3 [Dothideomycetes sp. NU457]